MSVCVCMCVRVCACVCVRECMHACKFFRGMWVCNDGGGSTTLEICMLIHLLHTAEGHL